MDVAQMCNMEELLKKMEERGKKKGNIRYIKKNKSKQKIDKKKTYRKQLYSDNKKSISIQILEKYLANKDKLNGVDKKAIRLNKNTLEFIEQNELEITCYKVK